MSVNPTEQTRRASASVLCGLLDQVAAVLRASSEFCAPGMEIITEDKGDMDTEIAQAIANLGLSVTVMFSRASGASGSMPGPCFSSVALTVEIAENALMNRSNGGRCALETADHAARLLHHARLADGRTLLVESLGVFPAVPEGATVCYHIETLLSNVSLNRKVKTT